MMDGMLSLSWKNHSSTFCHTIASLRDKERYTDATVACDGKFYPVHKLVLSTCSEYFEEMFEHTPCKHPVIVLRDVQCDELEAILNYMYAGVVSVAQSDLSRLIKVAELLKIKGLAVPDEPAETKTSEDRTGSRNKRTSPPGRSKTLPVTTDQVNSPSAKRRKTQESLTSLPASRGSDAEWLKDCSRGEPQNVDQSCIADEEQMRESSPTEDALRPETQELHIKDEIIEITSRSDSDHDDTGLDFGNVTEDSKEQETLDNNCQDEVSLLIPKYESSGLDSQGAGPLITQPMFSDGLGGAMSGSSDMQPWFPDQEAASSVVMDGENTNTGDTNLQILGGVMGRGNNHLGPTASLSTSIPSSSTLSTCSTLSTGSTSVPPPSAAPNPHHCQYCNYTTVRRSDLVKHLRTHTGERPFSCPDCQYQFTQTSALKTHMRAVHRQDKLYFCKFCHERFQQRASLQVHVFRVHRR